MLITGQETLKRIRAEDFRPHFLWRGPHLQTIASTYWPGKKDFSIQPTTHRVSLSDGDILLPVEDTPSTWKPEERIIVMLHGLTGCHQSTYLVRIGEILYKLGYKVIRLNLRNAGPSLGLSKRVYHCGVSHDLREFVQWIGDLYPESPITLMGFSLGGNVVLKMLGEDGERVSGSVDSAVAVSPPVNPSAGAKKLRRKENLIYNWFFTHRLKKDIHRLHQDHPKLEPVMFPKLMDLIDFDDLYTAPNNGFASGEDYYAKVGALPLLPHISCRTLILGALDDPVVELRDLLDLRNDSLEIVLTDRGGHVAFIDRTVGLSWMDHVILQWVGQLD